MLNISNVRAFKCHNTFSNMNELQLNWKWRKCITCKMHFGIFSISLYFCFCCASCWFIVFFSFFFTLCLLLFLFFRALTVPIQSLNSFSIFFSRFVEQHFSCSHCVSISVWKVKKKATLIRAQKHAFHHVLVCVKRKTPVERVCVCVRVYKNEWIDMRKQSPHSLCCIVRKNGNCAQQTVTMAFIKSMWMTTTEKNRLKSCERVKRWQINKNSVRSTERERER